MRLKLFLSAAAAVCLAWPAAGFADPPADRGGGDHKAADQAPDDQKPDKGHGRSVGRGDSGQAGQHGQGAQHGQGGPVQGAGVQTPTQVHAPATVQSGQVQTFQGGRHRGGGGTATQQTAPIAPTWSPTRAPTRTPTRQTQQQSLPALGDWNRTVQGPQREQAGQQWRESHRGWDRNTPWRRNNSWWRGDSAFRLFLGPRIGFFFIPGRGYVSVPRQYQDHYWRAGDYLPNWFWAYEVRDYYRYGLPRPPEGCVWVWVDNDIALIDRSDGYILDIVHNAW